MSSARKYDVTFFTATILEWKYLLAEDKYKNIVTDSLKYLSSNNRVLVHAFVIMNNHMHLLWHILSPHKKEDVQRDFLKYTSQMILKELRNGPPDVLHEYYVGAADRKYQIWERNPLSVGLWSEEVVKQKLRYVHENPVKEDLCVLPEHYRYSSAGIYYGLESEWDFVTPIYF